MEEKGDNLFLDSTESPDLSYLNGLFSSTKYNIV
ncbi:hypothetical protein T11_6507 [Trichinella zimbabwensis]|uniref:Uncharacterized protein n=1 Tax=Trichinella zimbabwensis TaxID=268475 RepID=A0A0V1GAZ6_9BILA|nr:hypothetical protein T11_6507 [Trichinella zimbabwensis]